MGEGFVHLHLHSEYSLLDGACRIADIPKAARRAGHKAVAITDHGVMYGVVDFYKACKKEGIKPIIGCEVYVARRGMDDRDKYNDAHSYHLVLLVKNETGYRNLSVLTSLAFTRGFYSKPRVDLELLEKHSEGLIALSACLAGAIPRHISAGEYEAAEEYALKLSRIFGEGNFYLELQDHGIPEQETVNHGIAALSRKTGIPMVATNDVHYINPEDAENQAALICIQTNSVISDGRPSGFERDEFYYKSTEEMTALFADYEGAVENTVAIADKCSFDFEFGKIKLPRFTPKDGSDPLDYLGRLAEEGLTRRVSAGHTVFTESHPETEYRERLRYELAVIGKMGYAEYFLIVSDFVTHAKDQGIPVGPGRGSGAGSLVAYLIGITDIDSIKYELLFERFLNPERISMPDFDIDFCYDRRDEVISYVKEKYGEDRAVQIITFGTLAARAAVRDVGRALGMAYADVDRVAREIPQTLGITLDGALSGNKSLREMYETELQVKKLIDIARALEGMPRHASTHAAGVVITDRPVTEYMPVSVNGGAVVTQFDMDTVAELGLLKFDFLALRYLTIIENAVTAVRESVPSFDLSAVDVDDTKTYSLISAGQTDGVFQLESRGMRQMLTQLKPRCIDDIIAAIALYRPGPMDSIPKYIKSRANPEKITYSIPALKPILDVTYGCIVYQEQVMQIFREVAGYSFGHADVVRRAISKKKSDVLNSERQAFLSGAVERGVSEADATDLFEDIVSFANYAFNKSHAAAYAVLSFRTAYLKAHYPREYYSALITSVFGSAEKIAEYTAECMKLGIKVLPPDVNLSRSGFCVEEGNIRYGLLSIRSLGSSFIDSLVRERQTGGLFKDFDDFISRMRTVDMNKKQLEMLIKAGALDSLGVFRSRMLAVFESVMDSAPSRGDAGQLDIFSDGGEELRAEVYRTKFPEIPELSSMEKLTLEKECCGVYLSGHILDDYRRWEAAVSPLTVSQIKGAFADPEDREPEGDGLNLKERSKVKVVGVVTSRNNKVTKKGDNMAFVTLEDRTGDIEVICFASAFEEYGYLLLKNAVIAMEASVSLRDGEVKLILKSAEAMKTDSELPPDTVPVPETTPASAPPKVTPPPKVIAAKKIFLKVPSRESKEYLRARSIAEIFEGSTGVIFYDSSTGEYLKDDIVMTDGNSFVIGELTALLGEANVVTR